MFLLDWLWTILYTLGFAKKHATILLLGLDNAGKTTLLHKLKYGSVHLVIPTQRAQSEEIIIGSLKLQAWDLGGHEQVRSLWQEYFFGADAIVFLVDSSDKDRIDEASLELSALLEDEHLKDVPFAVLGNKSDLPSLSLPQLQAALKLQNVSGTSVQMFSCSVINGTGYGDAFRWLSEQL